MNEQTPGHDGGQHGGGPVPAAWPPPSASAAPPPPATSWLPPHAGLPANVTAGGYPSYPHPEPVPYHQMLRTWSYAWWKPLAGIGLLLALFLVVQMLVAAAVVAIAAARSGSFLDNLGEVADLGSVTPTFLLLLNLALGAMILASWVSIRVAHRMRPRWLTSVAPKMRWGFFWVCVGLSVVALAAQTGVSLLLPADQEMDLSGGLNEFTTTTAALAVIVLLTTPLQAAGEEYLFRGYLMQAVGSLLGFSRDRWVQFMSKWVALLSTSLLFAVAHGAQNFPLFFDRFMFGMIAGWLIVHTGGLEVGIAMHILNNFLAFGIALTVGDITASLNVSEISWWNVPLTLTQSVVYAGLVVVVARRMGIRNTTMPPQTPAVVPAQTVPV